jgi:hypothetical protein
MDVPSGVSQARTFGMSFVTRLLNLDHLLDFSDLITDLGVIFQLHSYAKLIIASKMYVYCEINIALEFLSCFHKIRAAEPTMLLPIEYLLSAVYETH